MNLRKVFNGSQVGDAQGGGFRRCWGEWNDHTEGESYPNNTYQAGYGSRNQLWENILGTWNTLGDLSITKEGVMSIFCGGCNPGSNAVTGTKVLGSVLYITPGATFAPEMLVWSLDSSDITMRDIAMVIPPGTPTSGRSTFSPGAPPPVRAIRVRTAWRCTTARPGSTRLARAGRFRDSSRAEGWQPPRGGRAPLRCCLGSAKNISGGTLTDDAALAVENGTKNQRGPHRLWAFCLSMSTRT